MEPSNNQQQNTEQNPAPQPVQSTPEPTTAPAPEALKHNVTMSVLSYIGPLVIVSFIVAKDDPFVKFHIKQGLVLLVIEIALSLIGSMMHILWPIIQIVQLVVLVLAIIGIYNAVKGKEKELPLVGKFAQHFKI
jgi:uncharacterized membrane protein